MPSTYLRPRRKAPNRASCHSEFGLGRAQPSRANVNLNILFIELPGEATARLSTSPSFAGARATVRQNARLPLQVFATRARCPHCVRFTRRTDIENASITSGKCRFCCRSRLQRIGAFWPFVKSRGFALPDAVYSTPPLREHRTWAGGGRATSDASRRRF
jgi:hypothetical protein